MSTPTAAPERTQPSTQDRQTRCFYVRDDLIADVDALVASRRRSGEPRLKRSHAFEEAIEQWLALNSRKYDSRLSENGHTQ